MAGKQAGGKEKTQKIRPVGQARSYWGPEQGLAGGGGETGLERRVRETLTARLREG